jgi:hypothetical protein
LEILFWKFYKVNILYKRHQADLNFGAKHTLNRLTSQGFYITLDALGLVKFFAGIKKSVNFLASFSFNKTLKG